MNHDHYESGAGMKTASVCRSNAIARLLVMACLLLLVACGDSGKPADGQASSPQPVPASPSPSPAPSPVVAVAPKAQAATNDPSSLVLAGDLAGLRAAQRQGVPLNQVLSNGWTLMHLAAAHGQREIADWLIEQGLSLTSQDALGQRPFDLALVSGHADLAARLMPTEGDATAHTMLAAIAQGDRALVEKLLKHVPDPGVLVESRGVTPLHQACLHRQADILKLLLTKASRSDVSDRHGRTALHMAAMSGAVDCALLLLDAGAAVDAADPAGYTSLHLAALAGDVEMVKFLLSRKADRQRASPKGTAVALAADRGELDVLEALILPATP